MARKDPLIMRTMTRIANPMQEPLGCDGSIE